MPWNTEALAARAGESLILFYIVLGAARRSPPILAVDALRLLLEMRLMRACVRAVWCCAQKVSEVLVVR